MNKSNIALSIHQPHDPMGLNPVRLPAVRCAAYFAAVIFHDNAALVKAKKECIDEGQEKVRGIWELNIGSAQTAAASATAAVAANEKLDP